jgi:hypothetical protein
MPIRASVVLEGGVTGTGVRGQVAHKFEQQAPVELAQGTAANQADKVAQLLLSIGTGATNNLDLAGGVTDVFGVTTTFVKCKGLRIKNRSTNTTAITIGNGTNPFVGWFGAAAHTVILEPGDEIWLFSPGAGKTVTASTGDILKIVNASGATAEVEVDVIGTSA